VLPARAGITGNGCSMVVVHGHVIGPARYRVGRNGQIRVLRAYGRLLSPWPMAAVIWDDISIGAPSRRSLIAQDH